MRLMHSSRFNLFTISTRLHLRWSAVFFSAAWAIAPTRRRRLRKSSEAWHILLRRRISSRTYRCLLLASRLRSWIQCPQLVPRHREPSDRWWRNLEKMPYQILFPDSCRHSSPTQVLETAWDQLRHSV